jgi:hypothetical protein
MSFLGLPIELRTCIYRFVIPGEIEAWTETTPNPYSQKIISLRTFTRPGVNLMLVNHAIKAEAEALSLINFLSVDNGDLGTGKLTFGPGILRFVRQFRVQVDLRRGINVEASLEGPPTARCEVKAVDRQLRTPYRSCSFVVVKINSTGLILKGFEYFKEEIIFTVPGPRLCENLVAELTSNSGRTNLVLRHVRRCERLGLRTLCK